ncbi:MAG: ammonium transporter [Desulfamplus sp.]|nr:ammonium transporter [Desulfamplus sp.]
MWTVWNQLAVQLIGITATILLVSIGTLIICIVVEKSLGFRIDVEKEVEGLDKSLHG